MRDYRGLAAGALERLVMAHRYLYYVLGQPVLADHDYDRLETYAATVVAEGSPVGRVGGAEATVVVQRRGEWPTDAEVAEAARRLAAIRSGTNVTEGAAAGYEWAESLSFDDRKALSIAMLAVHRLRNETARVRRRRDQRGTASRAAPGRASCSGCPEWR